MPGELVRTAEVQVVRRSRALDRRPPRPAGAAREGAGAGHGPLRGHDGAAPRRRPRPRRRADPHRPRLPRRHQGRPRLHLWDQRRRDQDEHRPGPRAAHARARGDAPAGAGAGLQRQGRGPAAPRPPQRALRGPPRPRGARPPLGRASGSRPGPSPPSASGRRRAPTAAAHAASRQEDVRAFGWTPYAFAAEGLLRFCFAEAADMRSQLSFLEERVPGRAAAARRAGQRATPGALGLADRPAGRATPRGGRPGRASELMAGPFADLAELVDWLADRLSDDHWTGGPGAPGSPTPPRARSRPSCGASRARSGACAG